MRIGKACFAGDLTAITKPLGTVDPDVRLLQEDLRARGFYAGPTTGGFYSLTLEAVRKFQSAHGIPATGFVGPLTREALNRT